MSINRVWTPSIQPRITHRFYQSMSGYKNFAIAGAGTTGNFIVRQFLKDKAAGVINQVIVLTRQVSIAATSVD